MQYTQTLARITRHLAELTDSPLARAVALAYELDRRGDGPAPPEAALGLFLLGVELTLADPRAGQQMLALATEEVR